MSPKKLTLATVGSLERGYLEPMYNAALNRAMQDCQQRPSLDKPRSVLLQVDITPNASPNGPGFSVAIIAHVKEKFPTRQTSGEFLDVIAGATADGEPEVQAVFAVTPLFEGVN